MKKDLPAWQQVVLTVLNNVSKAKGGRDAWEKLNAEEQTAVMEFVADHSGGDARDALEETFPLVERWQMPWWLALIAAIAVYAALYSIAQVVGGWAELWMPTWSELLLEGMLWVFLIGMLCLDDRSGQLNRLWNERRQNQQAPAEVLKHMFDLTQMTRWQAKDKETLLFQGLFYGILLVMRIVTWYFILT